MSRAWEIDRSRVLDWQSCPRKRYWGFHYLGTGIQKKAKSLPLAFGGAFHEGSAVLLTEGDVERAVAVALADLDTRFAESGIDLEMPEANVEYGMKEQRAIVEGLLRGWWLYNGKSFLERFEVIEAEREGRAELGSGVTLMFRPDALVRERETGDLFIVSWKTASTFGERTVNQARTDMQSMSECWGLTHTHNPLSQGLGPNGAVPPYEHSKIEGVLYLFAVKGQRRQDDYLGHKIQSTPLAYGWYKKGATPDDDEWSHAYEYETGEINEKTGKPAKTKLGKGWRKVLVSDFYPGGVKAWVEGLAAQTITPRHVNALEAIFPQMLPVERRADEIESWRRQTVAAESRVRQRVIAVEQAAMTGESKLAEVLDAEFPQHTARCFDYNSKCQFYDVCFSPAVGSDPIGSGLYQIRLANHPERGDESE